MSYVIDDLENFAVLKIFQWHLIRWQNWLVSVAVTHLQNYLRCQGSTLPPYSYDFPERFVWKHDLHFYPSALRAGGVLSSWSRRLLDLRDPYLCNRLTDFLRSKFCELSRPVIMHCHGHLPIWLAHGQKTCQIWHKLGPDFAENRSLGPLDGFSPF